MADDATVRFGYDGSELDAGLRAQESRLTRHGRRVEGMFGRIGSKMGASLAGFAGALAAMGMAKVVSDGLEAVLTFDRLNRSLLVLEGSAQGVAARLEKLREVALLPGVDFKQAVAADVRLRNVGYSAEQSAKMIAELGNQVAKAGGSAEEMDGLVLAFTQIAGKGKVFQEELNQVFERLPAMRNVMKDAFGTADPQALQDMALTAQEFQEGMIDAMMASERAVGGLDESLSAMGTNWDIAMNALAKPIVDEVVPQLEGMSLALAENADMLTRLGESGAWAFREIAGGMRFLSEQLGANLFALFGDGEGIGIDPKLAARLSPEQLEGLQKQMVPQDPAKKTEWAQEALKKNREEEARMKEERAAAAKAEAEKRQAEAKARMEARRKEMEARLAKAVEDKKLKGAAGAQKSLDELKKEAAREDMTNAEKLRDIEKERAGLEGKAAGMEDGEEKLRLQAEILKLQREERKLKQEMAEELKDSAEEAMRKEKARIKAIQDGQKELERLQKEQEQKRRAAADFVREIQILEARVRGDKKRVGELERQARIEEEKLRIMQEQGVSEAQALEMARQKIALEDKLERKSQGREERKRINAHIEGGAAGARARAAERAAASEQKRQAAAKASWKGLDGYYADQKKGPIVADTPSLDRARGIVKKEQEQKKPQGLYEVTVESKDLLAKLQADMAKLVAPT